MTLMTIEGRNPTAHARCNVCMHNQVRVLALVTGFSE